MKTGIENALALSLVMGLVILFCRAFPFLFFRDRSAGQSPAPEPPEKDGVPPESRRGRAGAAARFLSFVEKAVPPAAMTVLAFNAIAGQVKEALPAGFDHMIPALAAPVLTALLHLWRRNPLISIFGGTAAFMILDRLLK
ncbi:MAG: AzlD domain-containing protein [Treponema sp.]|jgi:branched-subunit amino acid transport protein AzlD|nr:AzlD domain-containing protein [Treponema sp.]